MLTIPSIRELCEPDEADEVEIPHPREVVVDDRDDGDDGSQPFAVFDIETSPLDDVTLSALCPPYEAPEKPGEFDPASVKYGNTKDAEKRKAKLEEEMAKHAAAVKDYDMTVAKGAAEHFAKFKDKAALDATTGRVVAIGVDPLQFGVSPDLFDAKPGIIDCDGPAESFFDELSGLKMFWGWVENCLAAQRPMLSFNGHVFDIPFLWQRSVILGIPIPHGVYQGRYPNPLFIDLMKEWTRYQSGKFVKLDVIAKAMGLAGKASGSFTLPSGEVVVVDGAGFYKAWRRPECRELAVKYLEQDVLLPGLIAQRMGVV